MVTKLREGKVGPSGFDAGYGRLWTARRMAVGVGKADSAASIARRAPDGGAVRLRPLPAVGAVSFEGEVGGDPRDENPTGRPSHPPARNNSFKSTVKARRASLISH